MILIPTIDLHAAAPDLDQQVARRAEAAYTCTIPKGGQRKWLMVGDFSKPGNVDRFFVFDMTDPENPVLFLKTRVAHGKGSEGKRKGVAALFGNALGSGQTSLGMYTLNEPYAFHGRAWNTAYRLDGLTTGWNDNARQRGVVFHRASYVTKDGPVGVSLGCPAVNPDVFDALVRAGVVSDAQLWLDGPVPELEQAPGYDCGP